MEPRNVLLDDRLPTAGEVVALRHVLREHAFAERGLVPRDLLARARARVRGRDAAPHEVDEIHRRLLSSRRVARRRRRAGASPPGPRG